MSKTERWSLVVNSVLATASVVTVLFVAAQLCIQRDALVRIQRAFIFPEYVELCRRSYGGQDRWEIITGWHNAGLTESPAVTISVGKELVAPGTPPNPAPALTKQDTVFLGPQAVTHFGAIPVTIGDLEAVNARKAVFNLYWRASYTDIFGAPHITNAVWQVRGIPTHFRIMKPDAPVEMDTVAIGTGNCVDAGCGTGARSQ